MLYRSCSSREGNVGAQKNDIPKYGVLVCWTKSSSLKVSLTPPSSLHQHFVSPKAQDEALLWYSLITFKTGPTKKTQLPSIPSEISLPITEKEMNFFTKQCLPFRLIQILKRIIYKWIPVSQVHSFPLKIIYYPSKLLPPHPLFSCEQEYVSNWTSFGLLGNPPPAIPSCSCMLNKFCMPFSAF